jgi:hypothetical protein
MGDSSSSKKRTSALRILRGIAGSAALVGNAKHAPALAHLDGLVVAQAGQREQ